MTTQRKKLIEVSMPLEAINKASAREKVHSARPSLDPAPVVGEAPARRVPRRALRTTRRRSGQLAGGIPNNRGPGARTRASASSDRRDGAVEGDQRRGNPEQPAMKLPDR